MGKKVEGQKEKKRDGICLINIHDKKTVFLVFII